jgi:hypothetical protein
MEIIAWVLADEGRTTVAIAILAHILAKVWCMATKTPAEGTAYAWAYKGLEILAGLWGRAKQPAAGKVIFTPPKTANPAEVDAELKSAFDKLLKQSTPPKPTPSPELDKAA